MVRIQTTGGVIALSCWAPLHKQLPAQATPANLEVPYLQVTTYLQYSTCRRQVTHLRVAYSQFANIIVSVPR